MRPEDQDDYRDRAGRVDRREAMPPILGQVVDLGHFPADDEKRHVYAFKALSGGFDRAEGGTIRLALVGEPLFAVDLTPPGAGAHPQVGDQHVLRWIGDRLAFSAGSIGGMLSLSVVATSYSIALTPNANPFRTDPPTNGFVTSKGDGSRFHIDLYLGIWWNPDFDPVDETSGPDREVADPTKPSPFTDPKIYVPEDPFWSGALADVPPPLPAPIDPTTPPGFVPPPHDPGDTIAGGGIDVYPGRRCKIFFRLVDTADYYGFAYERWGSINFQNRGVQDVWISFTMSRLNLSAQDRLKWLCPPVHHPRRDASDRLQSFAGIDATARMTVGDEGNGQIYRVPGGEPIPVTWPIEARTDTGEALDSEHPEDAIGTEGLIILRGPSFFPTSGAGDITVDASGYVPAEVIVPLIGPFGVPVFPPQVPGANPWSLLFCKDNMDGYTGTGDAPTFPPCFPRKLSLTFWKTAVSASMSLPANLTRYPGCATKDGFEWLGDYAGEEVTIEIHNVVSPPAVSGVLPYVNYQSPCRADYHQGRTSITLPSVNINASFNPAGGGNGTVDVYTPERDCTGNASWSLAGFELHFPPCADNEDRPTTGPIYLWNAYDKWFSCFYWPNIFSTLPEAVAIYDLQIGVWSIED